MYKVNVNISLYIPGWLHKAVRTAKRKGFGGDNQRNLVRNLLGDREIEWSWVASQLSTGEGEVLDLGSGGSMLGLIAAERGLKVLALDLAPPKNYYTHANLSFLTGDILEVDLPDGHFDVVINCSTVEHIGLAGRYGITEYRADGDLEAMARLHRLMKPGAVMLLTVPIGQDALFAPATRIYGGERLPMLLRGFVTEKEEFWVKNEDNLWEREDRETAIHSEAAAGACDPLRDLYAIGNFLLRKPWENEGVHST